MAKYKVLGPLDHNGEVYGKGGTIELEKEYADPLLEVGVIAPIKNSDSGGKKQSAGGGKQTKKTDTGDGSPDAGEKQDEDEEE